MTLKISLTGSFPPIYDSVVIKSIVLIELAPRLLVWQPLLGQPDAFCQTSTIGHVKTNI
jgi:hypothetical protein